jgi:hypothetical protein
VNIPQEGAISELILVSPAIHGDMYECIWCAVYEIVLLVLILTLVRKQKIQQILQAGHPAELLLDLKGVS